MGSSQSVFGDASIYDAYVAEVEKYRQKYPFLDLEVIQKGHFRDAKSFSQYIQNILSQNASVIQEYLKYLKRGIGKNEKYAKDLEGLEYDMQTNIDIDKFDEDPQSSAELLRPARGLIKMLIVRLYEADISAMRDHIALDKKTEEMFAFLFEISQKVAGEQFSFAEPASEIIASPANADPIYAEFAETDPHSQAAKFYRLSKQMAGILRGKFRRFPQMVRHIDLLEIMIELSNKSSKSSILAGGGIGENVWGSIQDEAQNIFWSVLSAPAMYLTFYLFKNKKIPLLGRMSDNLNDKNIFKFLSALVLLDYYRRRILSWSVNTIANMFSDETQALIDPYIPLIVRIGGGAGRMADTVWENADRAAEMLRGMVATVPGAQKLSDIVGTISTRLRAIPDIKYNADGDPIIRKNVSDAIKHMARVLLYQLHTRTAQEIGVSFSKKEQSMLAHLNQMSGKIISKNDTAPGSYISFDIPDFSDADMMRFLASDSELDSDRDIQRLIISCDRAVHKYLKYPIVLNYIQMIIGLLESLYRGENVENSKRLSAVLGGIGALSETQRAPELSEWHFVSRPELFYEDQWELETAKKIMFAVAVLAIMVLIYLTIKYLIPSGRTPQKNIVWLVPRADQQNY